MRHQYLPMIRTILPIAMCLGLLLVGCDDGSSATANSTAADAQSDGDSGGIEGGCVGLWQGPEGCECRDKPPVPGDPCDSSCAYWCESDGDNVPVIYCDPQPDVWTAGGDKRRCWGGSNISSGVL